MRCLHIIQVNVRLLSVSTAQHNSNIVNSIVIFSGPVSMPFSQSDCFVCSPVFHDTDVNGFLKCKHGNIVILSVY